MSTIRNNLQVLVDIATEKFQQEWIERYKYAFEREWNESECKTFIKKEGSKVLEDSKKIQRTALESGNVKKWDLTLLQMAFKKTDWPKTKKLTKMQQSRTKILSKAVEVRNKVFHSTLESSKEKIVDLNQDLEELKKLLVNDMDCDAEIIDDRFLLYKSPEGDKSEIFDPENDAKAAEYRELGNKAFREQKWMDAMVFYLKALELKKISKAEKAKLHSNRSATHIKLLQLEQGLSQAKEVIKLFPEWPRGYVRKGDALMAMFNYRKAKKEYEYALALNPSDESTQTKFTTCETENEKILQFEYENNNKNNGFNPMFLDGLKYWREQKLEFEKYELKIHSKRLNKLSSEGDWSAHTKLAFLYLNGLGVEKDVQRGLKMLGQSSEKNNAEALYNLGLMHLHGMNVQKNLELAWDFFNRAIKQNPKNENERNVGVAESYHAIGNFYHFGRFPVSKKDHKLAFENYKKSADLGYVFANSDIGSAYHNGYGVKVDFDEAIKYYELAAKSGDFIATMYAATLYIQDFGPSEKQTNGAGKAKELLTPLAEKGYPPAIQLLKQIQVTNR